MRGPAEVVRLGSDDIRRMTELLDVFGTAFEEEEVLRFDLDQG